MFSRLPSNAPIIKFRTSDSSSSGISSFCNNFISFSISCTAAVQTSAPTQPDPPLQGQPQKKSTSQQAKKGDTTSTQSTPPSATPPPAEQPSRALERAHASSPALSVSVTSEPTFSGRPSMTAMRSVGSTDDSIDARNLWLPPAAAFGFAQLTNFKLSGQLNGNATSDHSLAVTATTHFI